MKSTAKSAKPQIDRSGIVTAHPSAPHLNGALIRIAGIDHIVTARHLGIQAGQKVRLAGRDFTIAAVRGVDIPVTGPVPSANWREDRLLNGDIAVATLREPVGPTITRYPLAGIASGTGYIVRGDSITKFPFQPETSASHWLRGSKLRPLTFRSGDSGRPIFSIGKDGRTYLVSVLSRIWWGEWAFLKPHHFELPTQIQIQP